MTADPIEQQIVEIARRCSDKEYTDAECGIQARRRISAILAAYRQMRQERDTALRALHKNVSVKKVKA